MNMNKLHKIIAASLLASAATTGSGVALAESPLTANIAVGTLCVTSSLL